MSSVAPPSPRPSSAAALPSSIAAASSSVPSVSSSAGSGRRPPLIKCVRRPRLQRKMVLNLVARRYGSLHDFSRVVARWCDISRATGLHVDTIRKAIGLFHKKGDRYVASNGSTCAVGRPRTVTAEFEARITTREKLYEMRFLSLARRVELIRREYGVSLGVDLLSAIYKRNGVRYLQAKKKKRTTPAHEARLEQERIVFARKLDGLQRNCGRDLIYMDQTTFQIWPKPSKTWQRGAETISAPENYSYISSVTLFGAVGEPLRDGKLYMVADATDLPSVKKFLLLMASQLKDPYTKVRPYLIMDNHPS